MKSNGKVRILLADDQQVILDRVRSILSDEFDIVATVKNGRDAITEVQRLDPDVLVTDISMPVLDGLQATSQLCAKKCRTKVVLLTVHEDHDFVAAAFSAGASAYVSKSRVATDLIPAIREILGGRTYVSQSISF
jgi:DNA-binding NarL/FixJ family response regulator